MITQFIHNVVSVSVSDTRESDKKDFFTRRIKITLGNGTSFEHVLFSDNLENLEVKHFVHND